MTEPAFVLHNRPWRETSLTVELLTPGWGRLGVVARGGRRVRRGGSPALQPFTLLQVQWRGRGELRTLVAAEPEQAFPLAGERLFAGLYLNELLLRLLHREEAQPEIFSGYARTLAQLAAGADLEPPLRRFELHLLSALGYGFPLDRDIEGTAVHPSRRYRLIPDEGLEAVEAGMRDGGAVIEGEHLLALAADALDDADVLRSAKRLLRQALGAHLGDRPLRARELFVRYTRPE